VAFPLQLYIKLHAGGLAFDASRETVHATAGTACVRVHNTEELQILEEIYLDGMYHFRLNAPLLILDIGMNVAYTTLYFAAMHPEAIVCGYEPLAPTFRCALANIALNPRLQKQIRVHQFGLSDSDRTIDVTYCDKPVL